MPLSKLIDMEMDDEDQLDCCCPMPVSERARYPYGLRISMGNADLEKLGLDPAKMDIGDMLDMRVFAVVTDISANESRSSKDGKSWRIEYQIEKIAAEAEKDE